MFTVGDRIVLIKKEDYDIVYLTIGNIYTIIEEKDFQYQDSVYIKNDMGNIMLWWGSRFISLKEYRKQKLNKIYDDSDL